MRETVEKLNLVLNMTRRRLRGAGGTYYRASDALLWVQILCVEIIKLLTKQ